MKHPLHDILMAIAEEKPVAQVELITAGGNAGIATRIVEIDSWNRERLLPGTKLYTHSATPQPDQTNCDDAVTSVLDALATVRERYRGTKWGKAAECICDAVYKDIQRQMMTSR